MSTDVQVAWWNLENLFDSVNAPRDPDLAAALGNELNGRVVRMWHRTPVRPRIMPRRIERLSMSKNSRHVVPNPEGGWDVKKPGASRSSSHHDTQREAESRAKEIVSNAGGGEVRIHDRTGKIRDSDTVKPGNDPNPPKDRKH